MRLGMRIGMKYPQGGTRLSITSSYSMAWVGQLITLSGTCTPGLTVVVIVGGQAFGTDSSTGSGTWSVTAACPSVEGDNVPIVATAGGASASGVVSYVLLQPLEAFEPGIGETLRASTYITAWQGVRAAHAFSQVSDSYQPVHAADSIDYTPQQHLENDTIGTAFGDGVTSLWFAVAFQCDDPARQQGIMQIGIGIGSASPLTAKIQSGTLYVQSVAAASPLSTSVNTSRHVLVGQISGGNIQAWLDGASIGTAAMSGGIDLAGKTALAGRQYTAGYTLDGKMGTLAFGTTLTEAQRNRLTAALMSGWVA
jgi:hypothetical protein